MPPIRSKILVALVQRIAAAKPEWEAQLRLQVNRTPAFPLATVFKVAEDKSEASGNNFYGCRLAVGVELTAAIEDADPVIDVDPITGEPNPYLYLDRLVGELEAVIHSPDEWAVDPGFTDVAIEGHDVQEEDEEEMQVQALLRLVFTYRHQIDDPTS